MSVSRGIYEGTEALILRVTDAALVASSVMPAGNAVIDNSTASRWAPDRNTVCFVGGYGHVEGLVLDADLFQRVPITNDAIGAGFGRGFDSIVGCAWRSGGTLALSRQRGQTEILDLSSGASTSIGTPQASVVGWTDDGLAVIVHTRRSLGVIGEDGTVQQGLLPGDEFLAMLPR
ncbi:MAG: hypothetical protein IT185_12515 [Acidobacteria bacterium]|nr:hypothetical protein [Acidobacteriota bacterium]